jgi:hypothetical protein
MKTIQFLGLIQNGTGGHVHMSLAGPSGYFHSENQENKLDISLDLKPGNYSLTISVYTDGTFSANIIGDIQNAAPALPYTWSTIIDTIDFDVI